MRSSLSYIQTLEAKTKTILQEKTMCEDQLSTLKQRERSDRQSIQSLQQILHERQQDCANLRNQYELIERSISDLQDQETVHQIQ